MAYLVLVRHGQSEWNIKGLWTGRKEVPLTDQGRKEAETVGEELRNIPIDEGYSSNQGRSEETLQIILKTINSNAPVHHAEQLQERDYGDLTGKNKWDVQKEYGDEQFQKWRRGWDTQPPNGESLKDVYERTVPYYKEEILPQLQQGKNVLVVSSNNALRSLVKYIEKVSDSDVVKIDLATGEAYVYEVDNDGNVVRKEKRASRPNTS